MKLLSVELENWRKWDNKRIEFDERTTVIYGPNETGKSTILEALSRGFFDRSSSRAKEIRRITPLAALGDVSSKVRIEFTLNNEKYFLEKSFNHNRGTYLYNIVDSRRILLAQDEDADRKLIEMLEADLQSSGASKPSKWGAFYWLWTLQDNRELPSEGDPTSSLHLDQSRGAVLVTPKFHSVQAHINSRYSQFFTGTGRYKRRSPILETKEELDRLRIENDRLNLRITTGDNYKRELGDKLGELPKHEEILEKSKVELTKAREDAKDYAKIEAELDTITAKIKETQRNITDASLAIDELQKISNEIVKLQRDEKRINSDLLRVEITCKHMQSQLSEINKQIEKKENERREFEELLKDSRILYTKNLTLKQIKELEGKIERITALNKELELLRSKEKPLLITQEELEELDKSQLRIKMLEERLSESGLYVTINPGKKDQLYVEVDGNKIEENQQTAIGIQEIKISYENLGDVKVRANLQRARDTKVDIEHLQSKIKDALQKNSATSVEELKKSFTKQRDITNEIKRCQAEKTGIDERSFEEIQTSLNINTEKHHEYEAIERSELAIRLNPTDVDLGELIRRRESETQNTSDEVNLLREKREEINKEYDSKREEMIELRTQLKHLSTDEITKSLERQQNLIRKYGSEENQNKILEREGKRLQNQKKEHKSFEKRHKEIEKGPLAISKSLETKIENQEQIIRQHRASIEQLRGKVIVSGEDGSYSQLSEVESRMEMFEDRLQREELQANSIKMLKDVLEQQYLQTLRSVSETIKHDVKNYLSYVTGNLHDEIELDDNLIPVRLGERGLRELALAFEDGSSGLKEVLSLCVRLGVAKHLSERDEHCLVLDDPFVHVSSDRSEKMIDLINKVVAEVGLQVVILTHRPMEFAGFSGKMVDIQSV